MSCSAELIVLNTALMCGQHVGLLRDRFCVFLSQYTSMLCSKSLVSCTFLFLRLSIRYPSCIFHPCCLLLIFPLLLFPAAFSAPPYRLTLNQSIRYISCRWAGSHVWLSEDGLCEKWAVDEVDCLCTGASGVPLWHGARRISRLEWRRLVGVDGQRGGSSQPGEVCWHPGQLVVVSRHRLRTDAPAKPARPRLLTGSHATSLQVRPS